MIGFPKFKRYVPGQDPVSAGDMNRRAELLEAVARLTVSPPLALVRTTQGFHISAPGMAAALVANPVLCRVTSCTLNRTAGEIGYPSEVTYGIAPVTPGEAPERTAVTPSYGRPVYGQEGKLHPSGVGDLCYQFLDDRGQGGTPQWYLWILNEQIAGGDCGDGAPGAGTYASVPDVGDTAAPRAAGAFASVFTNRARKREDSLRQQIAYLARQVQELKHMPAGNEYQFDFMLDAATAGNTSPLIPLAGYTSGTIALKKVEGTLGTPVIEIQSSSGGGTWKKIPNNDNWEEPTFTAVSSGELRNLDLRHQKHVRLYVKTAGGAGLKYHGTFYGRK